jgi:RNA polymerase sigma-70 factor (ECF subfamily)
VSRYQDRVFHFLRLKTGQAQDAEDLTQTTFIAAYRAIHRYKPRHRFVTWLFTIARRQAISFYRGRRPSEALPVDVADARTPDQPLASREACTQVWSLARETLPESQVTALWLCYAEDMKQREIARAMGKTVAHVKVLLHRGRRALAAELGRRPVSVVPPPIPAPMVQESIR